MDKIENQLRKFLAVRSREIAKTLKLEKFEDKKHLKLSAELIAWCELLLLLNSK